MFRYLTLCFVYVVCPILIAQEGVQKPIQPSQTLMIPMRDGKELATDIYLPTENAQNLPCVLLRSPAGKNVPHLKAFAELTKAGYAVAIQDTRSASDSEGKTIPYLSDGWGKLQDGYDTVEWLAKNPLTNGKIGTVGMSALGITQLFMAPTAPPSLKCQYITVAAPSLYHHALYAGGQFMKNQAEGWLNMHAKDSGIHSFVISQPFYNDFWKQLNALDVASKVNVPAIHVGGWFDIFVQGTIDAFQTRQNEGAPGARGTQKLVIGPWPHFWPWYTTLGDFQIPKEGYAPPIDISYQRWFDHYLKGTNNGVESIPAVIYFVMGPFDGSPSSGNVWRTSDKWPIAAVETPFYLNGQKGLSETKPQKEETFSYQYNPDDPTPTIGGRNLFLESGPKDQTPIEKRPDVVVFTSDVLKEDIEVTGQIKAKIYFSSNQDDTDVVVRLTDVYPDGRSILIADGIIRLGVLSCNDSSRVVKKGCSIDVDIDLWSTCLVFAKGHSIRVSVSSANYPRFERNLNLGLLGNYHHDVAVAQNTIYVGPDHASHITLPIVRKGDHWLVSEPQKIAEVKP